MASVIIPVLLSLLLGPGVGQLYNKDYKKGALLIVASLVLLVASVLLYYRAARAVIPKDLTEVDPAALGLKHGFGASRAADGQKLPVESQTVTVKVPARDFQMVVVE
jgi:hypothetical protein